MTQALGFIVSADTSSLLASMVNAGQVTDREAARMQRALEFVSAQLRSVQSSQQAANQAVSASVTAQNAALQEMRRHRVEANQLTQAYRQLPTQITDVVTSLASGMPIWMVAIQQGGQIRDAFGGIIPAMRGVAAMMTPVTLAIGAVVAAAGAAAFAFVQGKAESKAFADGMALTGNTAGLTEGQFNGMVRSMADARNVGAGVVRDLMQVLATSGEQTGNSLEASARAAIALSKVNGQTAAETAAAFAGMGASVADWAVKANKAYNYLTAEQYKHIMALEAQGRTSEAIRLNMEALASTMESRNVRSLGYLESALKSAGTWWDNFWDSAKGIGRAETVEEKIAKLQERIAGMDSWTRKGGHGGSTAFRDATTDLETLQREAARTAMRESDKAAAQADEQEAILKASRGYQDSLLAIQSAGDALMLAQQQAGFTARRVQADRAYAELRSSAAQYRDELITIERAKLAAQEDAARKSMVIESSRVVKTEQEANARSAAVIAAQAKVAALAGERAKLEADYARFSGIFNLQGRTALESPQANFRTSEIAGGNDQLQQIRANADALRTLSLAQADFVRGLREANEQRAIENSRSLAGAGMGDNARVIAARQAALLDEFNQQRRQLESERLTDRISEDTFAKRLGALRNYYDAALAQEASYQEARARMEKDGSSGVARAMANFAEAAANQSRYAEQMVGGSLQRMEDAFVDFAKTGKLSFSSLFSFMAEEYLRNVIKMSMASMLPKSVGGGDGLGSIFSTALAFLTGTPHETGLDYVPYDGYHAILHKGERVQTALQARGGSGGSSSGTVVDMSGAVYNIGQGVSRAEVVAGVRQANAETEARILRRLKQQGVAA